MPVGARLRMGEFSRRVGESAPLLRAWETRYGLLDPDRTEGGLRLYTAEDERRVRAMRRHMDAGLSAAEAARLAKLPGPEAPDGSEAQVTDLMAALERSSDALDEPAVQAALDETLAALGLRGAVAEVILPFLRRLGARWAASETTVAGEHFASNIIGGRLRRLSEGWGDGVGPTAILACPPGERHELGLLAFGLLLREHGWRIAYLGADTPIGEIGAILDDLAPAIVVLAALDEECFRASADDVGALSTRVRVGIAGAGASPVLARRLGAEPLIGEIVDIADALAP